MKAKALMALADIEDEIIIADCFERDPTDRELLFEKAADNSVKTFGRESRIGGKTKPVYLRFATIPASIKAVGLAYTAMRDETRIVVDNTRGEPKMYLTLCHETGHCIDANDRKSWAGQSKAYREDRAEYWVAKLDKVAVDRIKSYWRQMCLQPRKIEIIDKVKELAGTAYNVRFGYL